MSRKKDRLRWQLRRQVDPDYKGFRGHSQEPKGPTWATLLAVTCRVCGHQRNIPVQEVPEDQGAYVCLRCRENAG